MCHITFLLTTHHIYGSSPTYNGAEEFLSPSDTVGIVMS